MYTCVPAPDKAFFDDPLRYGMIENGKGVMDFSHSLAWTVTF